ncbi:PTS sugar transporter subunit IIA, partial [Corallococcus exiguus]|uniref:PTS sugar transporter subunit IIA n=1 Tax=Corallococcus exiguus TaxID=83462 RepID=UPI001494FB5D
MRWMDFLSVEAIRPALRAHDSASLLEELAELLAPEADVPRDVIAGALRARERLGTTAMEGGVAIPHCRVEGVRRIVTCVGLHRGGLAFGEPEDGLVRIFVGVLAPPDTAGLHLNVLSRIAALLHTPALRDALLATVTASEARTLLVRAESALHPHT